ncbi:MAG: FadR/GntR family transcriptional regulator [Proteobacteria bacterium]|nr:FadR/GntR family transcriptional regulator [Pseudomonadota bacterium]
MKTTRSSDVVIKSLLDLIMKGEIMPGDKLPSTENLAKQTGTSVISAREALQNLASIGLVEISHGRGIFLTEGTPVMEELLEARKVIESNTAMMAARNIDSEGLDYIENLLQKMEKSIKGGDFAAFSDMDYEFHLSIGKAAGNRILLKILENIKELLRYQLTTINRLPNVIKTSSLRHREIFDAMKQGDPDLAGSIMTQHITEVIESWKQNVAPIEGKRVKNNKMVAQK